MFRINVYNCYMITNIVQFFLNIKRVETIISKEYETVISRVQIYEQTQLQSRIDEHSS